ncbi:MAG: hypothetical protein IPJ13_02505 [Saprospiraceae bacterium]|nr:hypothetical protein [Saprospiraceae bacterium]
MYIVASNYTRTDVSIFLGKYGKALLASSAIPGVFPPVIIDGELYVDEKVLSIIFRQISCVI